MTTAPEPLLCQWCRQPPTGGTTWWDQQPQCADPHACAERIEPAR
ncbi:hypothetical protein GA0115259_1042211 [Streptomyces sp. MnatMP-M17]|nr:hypothetical protein GA0115259_1042211 [Streptomyces sp. MnatMP-M17]